MQGPDHLYFLLDDLNRSLYVENGVVKRSSMPRPLEFTPDGWRNLQVDNSRNQKYFALDRQYTVPLEFVEDGAQILKDAYYKNGSEVKIYLGILKQKLFYDGAQYGWYYDKFIKGEIDFSNFNRVGPKVTVNIMEGGLSKLIKNREGVNYELDIDVPEAVKIKMDGVKLKQKARYLLTNGALPNDLGGATINLVILGNESISSINAVSEARVKTSNAAGPLWNTNSYFLTTGATDTSITLEWDFNVYLELAGGISPINPTTIFLQLHVLESDSSSSFTNIQLLPFTNPVQIYNHKHNFKGTYTATIPANRRCALYMSANQNREFTFFTYDSDGSFDVGYTYTHRTTYPKGLPPEYVYKKLIEKITDGVYQGESPVLAFNHDFLLTSGDALRGIPGAKLKTSLSDFFQSYNTQFDIGLGDIAGKARLDEKYTFIDYANPIDLGEVSKLKDKPAKEYFFSTLKIGYPEQTYDDVNGKQEFNNTHEFTSAITRETKELNLVSVYRADCYGAEFTRINLEGKTTTDSQADNDIWFIHTKKTPITDPIEGQVYELNRDLNPVVTGLLEPATVFNVYLSPKRCLERNGRYIHSCFYKMDTTKLTFQTTQKNENMATTAPAVVEKSDANVGGLLSRLFQPHMLEFETPAPVDLVELLEASPVRAFKGTFLGFPFLGIPVKAGIRASDFEAQAYQLLVSPNTDLEPLIEIFE